MKGTLGTEIQHYYVDESGDATIFGTKHRVMLEVPGVSSHFMVGLLRVGNPNSLSEDLTTLRNEILRDPYFKGIPSLQPEQKKTALAFHAKDDIPEIRQEVYRLLAKREDLRFFAVIKDKHQVMNYVLNRNQAETDYRYSPNELYDFCVRRLFRDRLHKTDKYRIIFAERLQKDRTKAMVDQLELARENFTRKYGMTKEVDIEVITSTPIKDASLQAVDYYLWALWRLYIYRESRYLDFLSPSVRLIIDIDDKRDHDYGAYYTERNPISVNKLPPLKNQPAI